ncbi:MAG: hypothetical protein NVSMB27_39690 [Ktedonobacteraceae bacterium]
MSTQEERLQIVEYDLKHYKTETIKAYGDMAMELVMLKGLTEDAIKRLMVVRKTLDAHTARFDRVEATLGEHTTLLQEHSTLLREHTARFDRVEATLGGHTTLLTQILARLPEKS